MRIPRPTGLLESWRSLESQLPEDPNAPVDPAAMTDLVRLHRRSKSVLKDARASDQEHAEAQRVYDCVRAAIAGEPIRDIDPGDDGMSTMRTVRAPDGDERSATTLLVTRFNMGERGMGLQLAIGERYVQLAPEQRLEFYAVLGELFDSSPPAGPLKGPTTITRDEVIEHLRVIEHGYDQDRGADSRAWLIERLAITEQDLRNWMTVTLSRNALELLRDRVGALLKLSISKTPAAQREVELREEIREALANAKPEEDE